MNLTFFQEPELEFGSGGTHVDMRFGITRYGPLDTGDPAAPAQLRVGLVGTEETITSVQQWLDRCRGGIAGKQTKLVNLFPGFPGYSMESSFRSTLVFHDRWRAVIRQRDLEAVLAHTQGDQTVRETVAIFLDHAQTMIEQGGPMVLVCAPPKEVLAAVDRARASQVDLVEQEIDEGGDAPDAEQRLNLAFHDVLKAEGLRLGIPIQMVRPSTYTGERRLKVSAGRLSSSPLQDEATRAWNIHTALYYKAGGIPWRLLRSAAEFATCFVGVSFYKSIEGARLLTSVAQVFNERGEGVIVKGAQAELSKDDRQPHVSEADAYALLDNAISVYRKEHRTSPARIVVHKTSKMTDGEVSGFQQAANAHKIDAVDLISLRRSFTRLFRAGAYPPLRGTFLKLQPASGILYLRGSVQFFETYPGMYVPRPIELSMARSEATLEQIAAEILSLSKLNWNNTQFDGGEPITVRAARRVGDILKCIPEGGPMQSSFRFYM